MVTRRFWPMLAGLALFGACSAQPGDAPAPAADDSEEAEARPRLTPVDTEIEVPALGPLSRIEIESELEPGAGCSLEQDGKNLLTAVEDDAIARPYGTLRHFHFDGDLDALWDGGAFTAGTITITIAPADVEGERIDEVVIRPAAVTVREEGQGVHIEMRAEWHCGA